MSVVRFEAPRRFLLGSITRANERAIHSTAISAIAVTTQNCQSCVGMRPRAPIYAPTINATRYATNAAPYATPVIHANCTPAHRQPPASRAVTASVGRHCIAST